MKKMFTTIVAIFAVAALFTSCDAACTECTYSAVPGTYKVCPNGTIEYCYLGTCVDDETYTGSQQEMVDALETAGYNCN
jgi:hypothetical protein